MTFEGKSVQVTRAISGPCYEEALRMTFGDGSTLTIEFDANVDHSACEHEGQAGARGQRIGCRGRLGSVDQVAVRRCRSRRRGHGLLMTDVRADAYFGAVEIAGKTCGVRGGEPVPCGAEPVAAYPIRMRPEDFERESRTATRPSTGNFQIAVVTVRSPTSIARTPPTFTDMT